MKHFLHNLSIIVTVTCQANIDLNKYTFVKLQSKVTFSLSSFLKSSILPDALLHCDIRSLTESSSLDAPSLALASSSSIYI